jgi:hypothetical protein
MERDMKQQGFAKTLVAVITGVVLLTTFLGSQLAFAQKVYRWVDDEGNVHYSETLPPDWEGETHDEIRRDGIVSEEGVSHTPPPPQAESDTDKEKGELPRDKSGMKRPDPLYSDEEKQQRMDRLLMLRYHSEEEMLEAMEIEINQLKYDERLLNSTRTSLEASLKSTIDVAGNRQRAGLEIPQETYAELSKIRARMQENQRSLRGLAIREENIREMFSRDLERWKELKEMYSQEETG